MAIKRKDFQKAASFIQEFLLKLDPEAECAELRDALNLALLQMQRYFRLLRTKVQSQEKVNGSLLLQSMRGLSPMTPFKDTPDKFVWKWLNIGNLKGNTFRSDAMENGDSSLVPEIHQAASEGNKDVIIQILETNPDSIFELDGVGRSALDYAVHFSHLDAIQVLLENGASVDSTAQDGSTAVHRACHDGNYEALQILISYGAKLNVPDILGRHAMHWACACENLKCLELLLQNGASVSVQDQEGMTPSMWACRMDHIRHLELLTQYEDHSSEPQRDYSGRTWVHWAVRRKEPLECLNTLLTSETLEYRDDQGRSVLHTAAEQGSLPACKMIIEITGSVSLDHRDTDNRTPLIVAAIGGHGEVVNYLLSQGADFHAVDNHEATVWDYTRAKQLHYCMLIVASYVRQKAKEEEEEFGPLQATDRQEMEATANGLNSLQINGHIEGPYISHNRPIPPPNPPSQPYTPRSKSRPNVVPTTRQPATSKRLPSNGEHAWEANERKNSSGKRRKSHLQDNINDKSKKKSAFSQEMYPEDDDVQAETASMSSVSTPTTVITLPRTPSQPTTPYLSTLPEIPTQKDRVFAELNQQQQQHLQAAEPAANILYVNHIERADQTSDNEVMSPQSWQQTERPGSNNRLRKKKKKKRSQLVELGPVAGPVPPPAPAYDRSNRPITARGKTNQDYDPRMGTFDNRNYPTPAPRLKQIAPSVQVGDFQNKPYRPEHSAKLYSHPSRTRSNTPQKASGNQMDKPLVRPAPQLRSNQTPDFSTFVNKDKSRQLPPAY